MKTITPPANTPTSEQKKQATRFVQDAAAASTDTAIEQLVEDGAIDREGLQRFLGKADRLKAELVPFLKAVIIELSIVVKGCLKLHSGGKEIVIKATDGTETLAKAQDVFTGYVDSDFKSYGTDKSGDATKATKVEVYEMTEDADFKKIFGGLDRELDDLCLTQAQIKAFARDHRDWLRKDGYATFFLFQVGDEFFVAFAHVFSDGGLEAYVFRFDDDFVWYAGFQHRVVLPQLPLKP